MGKVGIKNRTLG